MCTLRRFHSSCWSGSLSFCTVWKDLHPNNRGKTYVDGAAALLLQIQFFLTVIPTRPLSTSISVSFSAMFSKSLITDLAVSWWIISSQDPVLVDRVSHRRDRSTRTSQDTALPPSMPWMTERHSAPEAWNSFGGAAENRPSGSVKVSQSSGEAGNSRPSG